MGLLLTIAILWSLVCTLVVLPDVLALVGKAGRSDTS
jgi:predicted RND superfamily exporter protein